MSDRVFLSIKNLKDCFLLALIITLLLVIILSASCDSASKESDKEFKKGSQTSSEEELPESNNYEGLRFETDWYAWVTL